MEPTQRPTVARWRLWTLRLLAATVLLLGGWYCFVYGIICDFARDPDSRVEYFTGMPPLFWGAAAVVGVGAAICLFLWIDSGGTGGGRMPKALHK